MKFDWLKSKHHLFDFLIAILIVIVIVLLDLLIVKIKSQPAEDTIVNKPINEEVVKPIETIKIQPGQRVFIPILNFHHIDQAPENLSSVAKSFYLEPADFESLMTTLINNDYRPVFVSEIVNYLQNGQRPVDKIMAITFDDGNLDFYTQAWPILQKLKIKSSLYIMTGVRGNDWVSEDQIKELANSGLVEIGSHTVWHPKLTKVAKSEQLFELEQSRDYLKDLLNKDITILCYPFGLYNDEIKALAKVVGYQAGLTFDQDAWQNPVDLMALTRISVYPGLDVLKFLEKIKLVK